MGPFTLAVIFIFSLIPSTPDLDSELDCTGDLGKLDSESMTRCSDELEDRLDALKRFADKPLPVPDLDNESICTGDLDRLDSKSRIKCFDELEERLDALNRFVEQPFSAPDDLNSTDTSCRRCN